MEEKKIETIKILILGNQKSGKTALIFRYCDRVYNPHLSFAGTKVHFTNIQDKKVKIELTEESLVNAQKCKYNEYDYTGIIVDLTDYYSLRKIPSLVAQLKQDHPEKQFGVIGTKQDSSERKIDFREVESSAKTNNFIYYETSALTGDNILNAFNSICSNLLGPAEDFKKSKLRSFGSNNIILKKLKRKKKDKTKIEMKTKTSQPSYDSYQLFDDENSGKKRRDFEEKDKINGIPKTYLSPNTNLVIIEFSNDALKNDIEKYCVHMMQRLISEMLDKYFVNYRAFICEEIEQCKKDIKVEISKSAPCLLKPIKFFNKKIFPIYTEWFATIKSNESKVNTLNNIKENLITLGNLFKIDLDQRIINLVKLGTTAKKNQEKIESTSLKEISDQYVVNFETNLFNPSLDSGEIKYQDDYFLERHDFAANLLLFAAISGRFKNDEILMISRIFGEIKDKFNANENLKNTKMKLASTTQQTLIAILFQKLSTVLAPNALLDFSDSNFNTKISLAKYYEYATRYVFSDDKSELGRLMFKEMLQFIRKTLHVEKKQTHDASNEEMRSLIQL